MSARDTPTLREHLRALAVGLAAIMLLMTPATASADPPPVSPQAQAAGLVDVLSVIPDAVVDLRYATADNFVGTPLYPADARCLVHQSLAARTCRRRQRVSRTRTADGVLGLLPSARRSGPDVRGGARPQLGRQAQRIRAQPRRGPLGRRDAGGCTRACSTWALASTTSPRAQRLSPPTVSPPQQQANRALLRDGMKVGGLSVYPGEWWHFDGAGRRR